MGLPLNMLPPRVRKLYNATVSRKKKPPLNEPCPCGSGKVYKVCCGQVASEALFERQIKVMKLPLPQRNYPLALEISGRKWQADFAWLGVLSRLEVFPMGKMHLAVFLEGQVHAIKGKRDQDCERDNVLPLILPNWQIMKFTPQQVKDLIAIDSVKHWLSGDLEKTLTALQRKPKFL